MSEVDMVEDPDQGKITLNVGGSRYETLLTTLAKHPDTRLGELAKLHHVLRADEYFFDRNCEVFNSVLEYYRSGELHLPRTVCSCTIRMELDYWAIRETSIQPCCWAHYGKTDPDVEALECAWRELWEERHETEAILGQTEVGRIKRTIWRVMWHPHSSKYAKVYSVVSMMFLMAAIVVCVLGMVPSLNLPETDDGYVCIQATNSTHDRSQRLPPQPIFALQIVSYVCNAFFSVELLVRLIVTPRRCSFIKTPTTVINIIVLAQFYVMLLLDIGHVDACQQVMLASFIQVVKALRNVCIFRIFQLLLYFKHLQVLLRSLRDSVSYLLTVFVVMIICMVVFATMAFYVEFQDEDSSFKTIPLALWWAIVTMTTVGYGDIYPRTTAGYFVGAACAICGVLILALTIPILVHNFVLHQTQSNARVLFKASYKKMQELENQCLFKKSVLDDGTILVKTSKI